MKLDQVNHIPQRDGYGQGLLDLCAAREDVVVLDADVSASTRTNWVHDRYPDHFYNVGISEQDLVGTARAGSGGPSALRVHLRRLPLRPGL